MIETETKLSWVDANQAYLVAQFSRLKGRLGANGDARPAGPTEEMRAALETPPAIDRLCEVFKLSSFERDVLLLCAGVEMDSELAALCGSALGRPQRAYATFGLAMATLAEPHWSALTPGRPLRHFRLVELEPGHGLASAPMRIDERILHYLAGVNALDPRRPGAATFGVSFAGFTGSPPLRRRPPRPGGHRHSRGAGNEPAFVHSQHGGSSSAGF